MDRTGKMMSKMTKTKMYGYTVLDIRPHQRYVVETAAADSLGCRPRQSLLCSHHEQGLHRIWY